MYVPILRKVESTHYNTTSQHVVSGWRSSFSSCHSKLEYLFVVFFFWLCSGCLTASNSVVRFVCSTPHINGNAHIVRLLTEHEKFVTLPCCAQHNSSHRLNTIFVDAYLPFGKYSSQFTILAAIYTRSIRSTQKHASVWVCECVVYVFYKCWCQIILFAEEKKNYNEN